ncbi:FAD dependent oxidoreductase-domain-containing protein [Aspergillus pseudoustus]|uniref:FAD dependent oxidoreductase-domain-containing protein n=1 Tax=Aspergillus pseudoustus TaxID=1810923 RepID=A0ABR4JA61_9EURO
MAFNEEKGPLRVIIIGASITGLTLAHCLDKAGIDYVVLEKHQDILTNIGGALALQPNGCRVLDQLGVYDRLQPRADLDGLSGALPDGFKWRALAYASYPDGVGYAITVTRRSDILHALYTSLQGKSRVKTGIKVARIDSSPPLPNGDGPWTVTTAAGERYTGDVIVGADGVHSITRAEMWRLADFKLPGLIPPSDKSAIAADYYCFLGMTHPTPPSSVTRVLDLRQLHSCSHRGVFFMFCLNPDSTVYWFVLVKNDKRYVHPHLPRWSEEDVQRKLEEIADYEICSPMTFRDIWKITPSVTSTYAHEGILETWNFGRIVCIGDSVFKLTPNLAQGANLCIESAACLANALHELNTTTLTYGHKPTQSEIQTKLTAHLAPLQKRIRTVCDESYQISRMQSLETGKDWFMARYVQPNLARFWYYLTFRMMTLACVMSKPALAPNSITSFWRTQPHPLDSHRSTETLPAESDIVIIGAGYAGASVAHHILEQTKGGSRPSIVILEGREACSGATGRNGGHLKPDSYNRIATLAEEYGIEAATEVANFEARHVDTIRDLVEKEGIECDLGVTDAVDVQFSESHARKLKDGYDRLVAAGCGPTRRTRYTGPEEAEAFSGVKGAVACFSYAAGHLWPYKMIMHLLTKAIKRGVNLQTHTRVTAIERPVSGESTQHPCLIHTSRGTIKASKVIIATNGYTSAILPQYKNKIVPVRGTCSRIVAPPNHSGPTLTRTYTIRHNSWNYDYLIPRADGSIVVGGARPAFIDNPGSWYDVSDDSRILEAAVRYFDGYMQRHFVGWEESHAYTDRVWTGIMGYSSDGLPHVGLVPGKQDQWIIGGFTGHGMPQVFLAAEGVAKMVVNGMRFGETGLPRLFQTTQARLEAKGNPIATTVFKEGTVEARL